MASKKRSRAKRVKTAHTVQEHEQKLYSLLSLCFANARLKQDTELNSLARLACSSKQLRASVQQYVQKNVGSMLSTVAGQAHNAQKAAQEYRHKGPGLDAKEKELARTLAQAQWLCTMSGADPLTQQLHELLSVRRVPREVTQMVQSTGVQLTTGHLVEAAMARVEGLDTWVIEPYCRKLPPLVRAVFDSKLDKFKQLLPTLGSPSAPAVVDLLHLSINDSRSGAAAEALINFLGSQNALLEQKQQQLQQQEANQTQPQRRTVTRRKARAEQQQQTLREEVTKLEQHLHDVVDQLDRPALVEQLLATAVARRHDRVVAVLCHLPTVQRLPGSAVLQLLHRCIVHKVPCKPVLEQLLALAERIGTSTADGAGASTPAAAAAAAAGGTSQQLQLQQRQTAGQAAAAMHDHVPQAPDAASPRAAMVAAAATAASRGAAGELFADPVLQQQQQQQQPVLAGVAELTQLLGTAVQRGNVVAAQLLASQPAAQLVGTDTAVQLARAAVELRDDGLLAALTTIPAVKDLPASVVRELLAVSVLQGSGSFQLVRRLCSLTEAVAMTAAEMTSLLHGAVQQGSRLLVEQLASAAAVQSLTSDMVMQLLEAAVAGLPGTEGALFVLCERTPTATCPPAEVAQLIRSIFWRPYGNVSAVSALCQLAPAQLMSASAVKEILHDALETNQTGALQILCPLPGAQQLSGSDLYELLRTLLSLQRPTAPSGVAQLLFYLSVPAHHLTAEQIHDLLQEMLQPGVVSSSLSSALKALAVLPAAQEMPSEQAAVVVKAALRVPRASEALTVLLNELQPARVLPPDALSSLVRSALIHDSSTNKLDAAVQLLQLPAGVSLDASNVANLLHTMFDQVRSNTVTADAEQVVQLLCRLPAASAISPARFETLVCALIRLHGRFVTANAMATAWLPVLVALPAAKQLSPAAVESVIQAAVQKPWALKQLIAALDAGSHLDAAAVERLLQFALRPSVYITSGIANYAGPQVSITSPSIPQLVKLPAFKEVSPAAITQLMHVAVLHSRADALKYLCQLDGPAAALDKATLLGLVRGAVMRMTGKGVTYISRLLGPHGLSRMEIDALLKLNEEMGHAFDRSLGALLQGLLR